MSRPLLGAACALALAVSASGCLSPADPIPSSQDADAEIGPNDAGATSLETSVTPPPDADATADAIADGAAEASPTGDAAIANDADAPPASGDATTGADAADAADAVDDAGGASDAPVDAAPPTTLATDLCDTPDYAGTPYVSAVRGPFTLSYLPGTDAETELDALVAARIDAYDSQRAFLALSGSPPLTIVLSPNRRAAKAHGYAAAWADPTRDTAEVLYLPGDSFERTQYGHQIAHLLAAKVDGRTTHLAFLDEGIAELLDASGRDLHQGYVDQLRAGALLLNAEDGFDAGDVAGTNSGRSGSFVRLLVDTWGSDALLALWARAATTAETDGRTTSMGDVAETPAGLETALDDLLTATYGEGLASVRLRWRVALMPYYAAPPTPVADADVAAISAVIALDDWALTHGDAAALRSTMEGFYCDQTTDAQRMATASALVQSRGVVVSRVVSTIPIGRKSYPQVVAFLARDETRAGVTVSITTSYTLEHFPSGWRITYQPM